MIFNLPMNFHLFRDKTAASSTEGFPQPASREAHLLQLPEEPVRGMLAASFVNQSLLTVLLQVLLMITIYLRLIRPAHITLG